MRRSCKYTVYSRTHQTCRFKLVVLWDPWTSHHPFCARRVWINFSKASMNIHDRWDGNLFGGSFVCFVFFVYWEWPAGWFLVLMSLFVKWAVKQLSQHPRNFWWGCKTTLVSRALVGIAIIHEIGNMYLHSYGWQNFEIQRPKKHNPIIPNLRSRCAYSLYLEAHGC